MRFIELEDSEKKELVRRYANHKNATVRKRVQALILSSQYYSIKEIIEATGMSRPCTVFLRNGKIRSCQKG